MKKWLIHTFTFEDRRGHRALIPWVEALLYMLIASTVVFGGFALYERAYQQAHPPMTAEEYRELSTADKLTSGRNLDASERQWLATGVIKRLPTGTNHVSGSKNGMAHTVYLAVVEFADGSVLVVRMPQADWAACNEGDTITVPHRWSWENPNPTVYDTIVTEWWGTIWD